MKIEYIDDSNKGPGNGILYISEILIPDGPWSVAIQRASRHDFLASQGNNRWVGETVFIPLNGDADQDGKLKLFLGPNIVDSLDPRDRYRIIFKGADGQENIGIAKIGTISHSHSDLLGNTAKPSAQVNPEPPSQPQEISPASLVAPERVQEQAPNDEAEKTTLEGPAQIPMPEPATANNSARLLRYGILALLILVCIGWYFWDQSRKSEVTETASTPAAAKSPEQTERTVQDQVRQFFAGQNKTAQNAMALFNRLSKNTDADKDAVYRLLYFASDNDDGQAALEYGRCLDPAQAQWGSIQKDASLAWSAYSKAANSGIEEAKEAQENLKKWLTAQSDAGNIQAAQWLREIK